MLNGKALARPRSAQPSRRVLRTRAIKMTGRGAHEFSTKPVRKEVGIAR